MSTATAPGMLRDETPGPDFASPRKQLDVAIEVNNSDQEEVEIDESQVQRRRTHVKDNSGRKESKTNDFATTSPNGRTNRSPLVQADSSLLSINVISSSDDDCDQQPTTPIQRRKLARIVSDDSDDSVDELLRDTGKNVLRNTNRFRNSLHPVANDTIPRYSNLTETVTESIAGGGQPGSTSKMPWSITEGPDRDIVLSTPTSKQRIRHYNIILDSEDELSETEKSLDIWSLGEKRGSIHSRHLGLPQIDSVVGGVTAKSPPRAIVSDSEAEFGIGESTSLEQNDFFIVTQSTMGERNEAKTRAYTVESQEINELPERSRISPDRKSQNFQTITNLRKPRPLVLDIPSDEDTDNITNEDPGPKDAGEIEEQHKKLRETLMFNDIPEETSPSPAPKQFLRRKLDPKLEQTKFENSPFSNFPLFDRASRSIQKKVQEEESKSGEEKYYPLWKRKNEDEDRRSPVRVRMLSENEDEEETLEDPRVRRRSRRTQLASPPKKIRLTELAPDVVTMESALKSAAEHAQQQANDNNPCLLSRMETIESFSTFSDTQRTSHRMDSGSGRIFSQAEEIEDFSDDYRSQIPGKRREERKTRRYSGLQLVNRDHPKDSFRNDDMNNPKLQPYMSDDEKQYQDLEYTPNYSRRDIELSPTLSQDTMERCPICRMMVPAKDLLAHVDAELLTNERKEKEDMERRDKALALELNEIYQTQPVVIPDSLPEDGYSSQDQFDLQPLSRTKPPLPAKKRYLASPKKSVLNKDQHRNSISLDTPTRKVGSLTLQASPSPSKTDDDQDHRISYQPSDKFNNSFVNLNDDQLDEEQSYEHDSIVLSEIESLSSQSAFQIQPGQIIIQDIPSLASDTAESISMSSRESKPTQRSRKTNNGKKSQNGNILAPLEIQDDVLDDDFDDFLDRPEPASMMNRSFRTNTSTSDKASANAATASSVNLVRRNPRTKIANSSKKKQPSKGMIELDDSDDELNYGGEKNEDVFLPSKRVTTAKGSKPKFGVLDSLLPASARQRRQNSLKKTRHQRDNSIINVEDEIEIGRHQSAIAERLWNQEDDPFDSEHLDSRQVKGVGLGGVVGGIGAIPGSLTMSKITKSTAAAVAAAAALDLTSEVDATSPHISKGLASRHSGFGDDGPVGAHPLSKHEDTSYGLNSQDWWDNFQPGNPERSSENNGLGSYSDQARHLAFEEQDNHDEQDNGYTSPLDDFIDLRERRDDPSLAMYFAQFNTDIGIANGDAGGSTSGRRSRGRGRGRSRGGSSSKSSSNKKGVSFGPGVGPISAGFGTGNASKPAATQTVLTAYGVPRQTGSARSTSDALNNEDYDPYGARRVTFGGHPTTENGSMAVRSKPTQPFIPGKSRGKGKATGRGGSKSYWSGRWAARRGRGGRGRGA
ncbi:hypothetical protein BGZ49_009674 [Haplosporangium sp. Z 27]|nr:hypothetical protein BGZ49_009674 [Haplosporangium sp. Z 27]